MPVHPVLVGIVVPKKILVIDDDEPCRLALLAVLREAGYEVIGAQPGADALALALKHSPQLILSNAAHESGQSFDFLKKLRSHSATATIPVIQMTVTPESIGASFDTESGREDSLQKPFANEVMLATVAARLARQEQLDQTPTAAETIHLQTTALEAAANGIAIVQRDGKILWVNPAFTKLTGYPAAEIIGRTPAILKSNVHDAKFYERLWQTILAGEVWHGELINRRKDGTHYHEEMTITPVRNAAGEIQNFISVKQDVSARKEIEQKLAQERDLLQTLMDNQPDFIYFKDNESRYTRINRALAQHLGLPHPDDAIGKSDAHFFSIRAARQKLVDERRMFATGIPMLGLVESSATASEDKWVSSTKVPIRDRHGKITGLVGISHDITVRKQAEEALQQKQAEMRVLFDLMPAMIWFKDTYGRILRVNQRVADTVGKPIEQIEGKAMAEIYPRDAARFYADDLELIRANQPKLGIVEKFVNPDGRETWMQTDKVPVCDKYGKVIGIVVMAQDITERRLLEEEMEQLRSEYGAVLNSLGEGVHWIDVDGNIKFENPAAAKMLGFEVDELIGRPAHLTMHHTRADGSAFPQHECPIFATLRDRQMRRVTNEVFWRKDGTCFAVDYICTPIYDRHGNSGGAVVVFTDSTERKKLEAQLVHAKKLETVGQLAAGIAHEINTPTQYVGDNTRFVRDSFAAILKLLAGYQETLAAVKQNLFTPELLERNEALLIASDLDYLCTQIPAALDETLEGVERVSKIVRAMKEFSHPGGKVKSPADLNRAIQSTVTVAHNEWKYVADMKLKLEPNLPLVPCFVGEFNQCILNLIVNAAHAIIDVVGKNPVKKGMITIQTRRDGDVVEVRVADTGTGIPEELRPKIFEPFFTTKDVGQGSGQGLSIVYGCIVKRHGGTVTFETEMGWGTIFVIRLPLESAETAGPVLAPLPEIQNA